MGIYLDQDTKANLTRLSLFPWAPASLLTYLGIQLSVPSSNTLHINYEALFKNLQDICTSTHASWAGRIALSKMLLLPRLLYLFRNPPTTTTLFSTGYAPTHHQQLYLGKQMPEVKHSIMCTTTAKQEWSS